MTGEELKKRVLLFQPNQSELARTMGITRQVLDSKFRTISISLEFALDVANAVKVPVWQLLGIHFDGAKNRIGSPETAILSGLKDIEQKVAEMKKLLSKKK